MSPGENSLQDLESEMPIAPRRRDANKCSATRKRVAPSSRRSSKSYPAETTLRRSKVTQQKYANYRTIRTTYSPPDEDNNFATSSQSSYPMHLGNNGVPCPDPVLDSEQHPDASHPATSIESASGDRALTFFSSGLSHSLAEGLTTTHLFGQSSHNGSVSSIDPSFPDVNPHASVKVVNELFQIDPSSGPDRIHTTPTHRKALLEAGAHKPYARLPHEHHIRTFGRERPPINDTDSNSNVSNGLQPGNISNAPISNVPDAIGTDATSSDSVAASPESIPTCEPELHSSHATTPIEAASGDQSLTLFSSGSSHVQTKGPTKSGSLSVDASSPDVNQQESEKHPDSSHPATSIESASGDQSLTLVSSGSSHSLAEGLTTTHLFGQSSHSGSVSNIDPSFPDVNLHASVNLVDESFQIDPSSGPDRIHATPTHRKALLEASVHKPYTRLPREHHIRTFGRERPPINDTDSNSNVSDGLQPGFSSNTSDAMDTDAMFFDSVVASPESMLTREPYPDSFFDPVTPIESASRDQCSTPFASLLDEQQGNVGHETSLSTVPLSSHNGGHASVGPNHHEAPTHPVFLKTLVNKIYNHPSLEDGLRASVPKNNCNNSSSEGEDPFWSVLPTCHIMNCDSDPSASPSVPQEGSTKSGSPFAEPCPSGPSSGYDDDPFWTVQAASPEQFRDAGHAITIPKNGRTNPTHHSFTPSGYNDPFWSISPTTPGCPEISTLPHQIPAQSEHRWPPSSHLPLFSQDPLEEPMDCDPAAESAAGSTILNPAFSQDPLEEPMDCDPVAEFPAGSTILNPASQPPLHLPVVEDSLESIDVTGISDDDIEGSESDQDENGDSAFGWSDIHRHSPYPRRNRAHGAHTSRRPENIPVPSRDHGRYQNKAKRSLTPPHNGIKHRDELLVNLQADVRELARILMLRNSHESQIPSVSQEVAHRYKSTKLDAHGPNIRYLMLDLEGNEIATPWNKRAAELFAEAFVSRKEYECTDIAAVEQAFKTHIIYLAKMYKESLQQEISQDKKDSEKEKVRSARRRGVYRRRKAAFNDHNADGSLYHWTTIWKYMKMDGMSGDETDPENPSQTVITKLPWRNPAVDNWLRLFDKLHLQNRFYGDGRPTPGRFPHHRVPSSRPERYSSHAVPRLPRNFYSEDYLTGLNASQLRKLQVQEPIDLTIPDELLVIARRFRDVKNRKTPPLPENSPIVQEFLAKLAQSRYSCNI